MTNSIHVAEQAMALSVDHSAMPSRQACGERWGRFALPTGTDASFYAR
jgi:hypothetical protein